MPAPQQVTTPYQAGLETARRLANIMIDGGDRLARLQISAMRDVCNDANRQLNEAFSGRSRSEAMNNWPRTMPRIMEQQMQRYSELSGAWARTVAEIQNEFSRTLQEQLPEINRRMSEGMEQAARTGGRMAEEAARAGARTAEEAAGQMARRTEEASTGGQRPKRAA